jgi:hypothetical protein
LAIIFPAKMNKPTKKNSSNDTILLSPIFLVYDYDTLIFLRGHLF